MLSSSMYVGDSCLGYVGMTVEAFTRFRAQGLEPGRSNRSLEATVMTFFTPTMTTGLVRLPEFRAFG